MSTSTRRRLLLGGFIVCVLLVALLGPLASSAPDGLDKVARDHGFDETARRHALRDSPVAGYAVDGVDNDRVGTALAGVIGVSITFAVAYVVLRLVRTRRANPDLEIDRGARS